MIGCATVYAKKVISVAKGKSSPAPIGWSHNHILPTKKVISNDKFVSY